MKIAVSDEEAELISVVVSNKRLQWHAQQPCHTMSMSQSACAGW